MEGYTHAEIALQITRPKKVKTLIDHVIFGTQKDQKIEDLRGWIIGCPFVYFLFRYDEQIYRQNVIEKLLPLWIIRYFDDLLELCNLRRSQLLRFFTPSKDRWISIDGQDYPFFFF